jgi:oligopeptide/dipeptide ABC transporter ATP-binding protein
MSATGIAVMYMGRIVEFGPADAIVSAPMHPYTKTLLASVLSPGQLLRRPASTRLVRPPRAYELGAQPDVGCRFRHRCDVAIETCAESDPPLVSNDAGIAVACHASTPRAAADTVAVRSRLRPPASTGLIDNEGQEQ